jgi:hypothetical protein
MVMGFPRDGQVGGVRLGCGPASCTSRMNSGVLAPDDGVFHRMSRGVLAPREGAFHRMSIKQGGQSAQGVRGAEGGNLAATSQQGCAQHQRCQIPTKKKKRERNDDPARKTGGIAGVRKGMGREGGLQGFHQSIPL